MSRQLPNLKRSFQDVTAVNGLIRERPLSRVQCFLAGCACSCVRSTRGVIPLASGNYEPGQWGCAPPVVALSEAFLRDPIVCEFVFHYLRILYLVI